ncbi:hypothetical protein [Cytobacillus sp. FSL R5-0596]|uniref:hypothetical protein n=1 Tax=Cytobacillus sp. FSL R5-0596 TaxID=2954696 RepID=UPI0030FB61ED
MNALRDEIYNTLQSAPEVTYSIETLAHKYRTNEHVIRIQLDRLQQEGKQLKVTDEEVSIFLQHERPFWIYAGWVGIGFILYILFGGLING